MKKQLDGLTVIVRELKADNVRLTRQREAIAHENARFLKTVDEHRRRLDDIEAYTRSDNIIIKGLPEKSFTERAFNAPALADGTPVLRENHQSVEGTVLEFFN